MSHWDRVSFCLNLMRNKGFRVIKEGLAMKEYELKELCNLVIEITKINQKISPVELFSKLKILILDDDKYYMEGRHHEDQNEKCEHGKGLTEYCEPCGRIHNA